MNTADLTPSRAFDRYKLAFDADLLTQGSFHKETDGRHLACALGAIDDDLTSISKCPAHVMPKWLAQHVVYFFDNQDFDDAKKWGLAFYAELKRLNGQVPFSVVHDWQANVVTKLALEWSEKKKSDPAPHLAKQALHIRALAGDLAGTAEWRDILKPAFKSVYLTYYADANADAYADAYANANADAYADANADADADAYADAYADANADADADADAYQKAKQGYVKRLADGMIECMQRVPTPEAQ